MRDAPGHLGGGRERRDAAAAATGEVRARLTAIRAGLRSRADPGVRAGLKTLIPGARAIGVSVPALREFAAELRAGNKTLPLAAVTDVMDALAASRVREEILVGTFWLARYGRQLEALPWSRLARWLPALDNWETCDQLAMNVAAPVVAADPALVAKLRTLTGSRSEWVRRFVLATASALNQKGRSHVPQTLSLCDRLVSDRSATVRTGVGWALRSASERDAPAVYAFLRERVERAPRALFREGAARLPAGQRAELMRLATPRRAGAEG